MEREQPTVCVLDASTYVGFWIRKGLLSRGYTVHAAIQKNGETEIQKKIKEMEREEERLVVFGVDVLDYHSILAALKGCSALFCCLDSPDGYDDLMVDMEVRGAINVVEACAQTDSIEKIVFSSTLTAAIWRENIRPEKDIDETSWSDQEFCKKLKLWYALEKTLSEQAACLGLSHGPDAEHGVYQCWTAFRSWSCTTKSSTDHVLPQRGAQMYENGVLAFVYVNFLVDVHIRALKDRSTSGRYFCFNQTVKTKEEAVKLAQSLSPLISSPQKYESQASQVYAERLTAKKLNKLVEPLRVLRVSSLFVLEVSGNYAHNSAIWLEL